MHRLHAFGIGLTSFSAAMAAWSYMIIGSIPLTALGIGLSILGISIILTPTETVNPRTIRTLLEGSVLSLEALLEEFNVSSRGYYVMATDGRVYLYVPIGGSSGPPSNPANITGLVSTSGRGRYLVLIPPGSEIVRSPEIPVMSLEDSLRHILVELTDLADGVEVEVGERVVVWLKSPRGHISAGRFKNVFGSLEASIVACMIASILGVCRVVEEREMKNSRIIILEVVGLE